MENKDKIEVIREILYEESTRKMLLEQQISAAGNEDRSTSYTFWKWLAAASIIGILFIIGYNQLNDGSQSRAQTAFKVHEFPLVSKSRGANQNIVDSYIEDVNQKRYSEVLPLLEGADLSEKDKFVKVLMLFRTGEYENAKKIINGTNWKDPYHKTEMDWVLYLISFIQDFPLDQFENRLSSEYKAKAAKLAGE